MQISPHDAIFQTVLFTLIFGVAILVTLRKRADQTFFPVEVTNELKGFAILAIIFSHVGYFLSTDHDFLFPLSVLAGVGVDVFLFLSGYGLTISALKKPLSVVGFYKKRLLKLFVPLWIIVGLFFLLDLLIHQISYPSSTVLSSFLGFFPEANLFSSLNSPLWYFSFILLYYLIFPLLFFKKSKFLSPFLIFLVTLMLFSLKLPIKEDVQRLYRIHTVSFPLGMLFAELTYQLSTLPRALKSKLIYYPGMIVLIWLLGYFAIHSGVGGSELKEQSISILTTLILVAIFLWKRFRLGLLVPFGILSYEIYLIHWPILIRYGYLFKFMPEYLALVLYLVIFLGLGWLLKKVGLKLLRAAE